MSELIPYISNRLVIPEGQFTAIIGSHPSKGARSPILWNAAYKALRESCNMFPFDIDKSQLPNLLDWLKDNPRFAGGAVAVPHKELIAGLLAEDSLHASAKGIQAVNSLYRSKSGELYGANTDGLAAAQVLSELGLDIEDTVVVFGFGGVSKALVNAIKSKVKRIIVVTRSYNKPDAIKLAEWMKVSLCSPAESGMAIKLATVLINGTILGSAPDNVEQSPLLSEHRNNHSSVKIAFDVVYNPSRTVFLRAIPDSAVFSNGIRMNLLQAVQAFKLSHKCLPLSKIELAMATAANAL